MIHLLNTNMYRILRDRRLPIVIILYLSVFVMTTTLNSKAYMLKYTGTGELLKYHFVNVEPVPADILKSFTSADILFVALVYSMFLFADERSDKVFENMCMIYKSRCKVFLANYLSICSTIFIFTVARFLGVAVLSFIFGQEIVILKESFSIPSYLTFIFCFCTYIALFYSLYIFTNNVYVPLATLFGPFTITFCPRFMAELPYGTKLYDLCVLSILGFPVLSREMTTWDKALPYIGSFIAIIVVLLTISSIIVEKRDVK